MLKNRHMASEDGETFYVSDFPEVAEAAAGQGTRAFPVSEESLENIHIKGWEIIDIDILCEKGGWE